MICHLCGQDDDAPCSVTVHINDRMKCAPVCFACAVNLEDGRKIYDDCRIQRAVLLHACRRFLARHGNPMVNNSVFSDCVDAIRNAVEICDKG